MFTLPNWWLEKATKEDFDLVADDDFNPDGVLLFGYDAYETGVNHGIYIATACIGITVVSAIAAKHYIRKHVTDTKKGETNE